MSITDDTVKEVAHLARLAIDDREVGSYAKEISNILALVEQMNAVATDNIEPLAHPLDAKQRLRRDEVTESDQHETFQKLTPHIEADVYLVPKVIEE